jgi:hypothetical protein
MINSGIHRIRPSDVMAQVRPGPPDRTAMSQSSGPETTTSIARIRHNPNIIKVSPQILIG